MEKRETSSTVMVFQFIRGLIEKWTIYIFTYIFYKHVILLVYKVRDTKFYVDFLEREEILGYNFIKNKITRFFSLNILM